MSLWSPFAFNVYGDALPLAAPPELRVYDGVATEKQLAYAQSVFAVFCEGMRMSYVANPTEQGRLPDGSPYQITVVGNTTIMQLWADSPVEEGKIRGIGIYLTDIFGGALPGHTQKDGASPQAYILTPLVRDNSRHATGEWLVQKVDGFSGGKACNQYVDNEIRITGVQGVSNFVRPIDRKPLTASINALAYAEGVYGGGAAIYDGAKQIATFRAGDGESLPFFRKHSNGDLWIMQITVSSWPSRLFYLYGEKFDSSRTGVVGVLLHTLPFPELYNRATQSVSVSPDGKHARTMLRDISSGKQFKADILVGDASLALTMGGTLDSETPRRSSSTTTGVYGVDWTDTDVLEEAHSSICNGYGFGAKGQVVESSSGGSSGVYTIVVHKTIAYEDAGTHPVEGDLRRQTTVETRNSSMSPGAGFFRVNDVDFPFASRRREINEQSTTVRVFGKGGTLSLEASGFYHELTESDIGSEVIFLDSSMLFCVQVTKLRVSEYSGTPVAVKVGGTWTIVVEPPYDDANIIKSYRGHLSASHKGQEVFRVDIPVNGPEAYAISAAADPLTGALCVNLLEVSSATSRNVLRSWLFLVDDVNVNQLHQIMDIPSGTHIRASSDAGLLSV